MPKIHAGFDVMGSILSESVICDTQVHIYSKANGTVELMISPFLAHKGSIREAFDVQRAGFTLVDRKSVV